MKKNYRWRFIIDKRSQFKMLGVLILNIGFFSLLFILFLFLPSVYTLLTSNASPFESQIAAAKEFLVLDSRLPYIIPLFVFVLCIQYLFTTHKIFGPVYRFKLYLQTVASGDISKPVKIRAHDYLHDLEDSINMAIDQLNEKLLLVSSLQKNTDEKLTKLVHNIENKDITEDDISKKIYEIKNLHSEGVKTFSKSITLKGQDQ